MKSFKKCSLIVSLLLVVVMACALVACSNKCTEHVDANGDLKCDNCSTDMTPAGDGGNTDGGNTDGGNTDAGDGKTEYLVTLKDTSGNPVVGASVQIRVDTKNGETKTTDAQGKATFRIVPGKLQEVLILSAPEDYVYDDAPYQFAKNSTSLVIDDIVKMVYYYYKVILKDTDGYGVEGAEVQVCIGENCLLPQVTDQNGVTTFKTQLNGAGYITINSLPNVYTVLPGIELGVTHFNFDEGDYEETLTVAGFLENYTFSVTDMFGGDPMADIRISVYNKQGTLVAEEITDASGTFTLNIVKDSYYLIATHKDGNPEYFWLGKSDQGTQQINTTNVSVQFMKMLQVSYVVNVSRTNPQLGYNGLSVSLYDYSLNEVASADVEAGVATISAPYGNYIAVLNGLQDGSSYSAINFTKNTIITGIININDALDQGSSANAPLYLTEYGEFNVKLNEGEVVYVAIPNAVDTHVKTATNLISILYNDDTYEYDVVNDEFQISLEEDAGETAILKITALADLGVDGIDLVVIKEGTKAYPYEVSVNDSDPTSVLANIKTGELYYTFTMPANGRVTLASTDDVSFKINGEEKASGVFFADDLIEVVVVGDGIVNFSITYEDTTAEHKVLVAAEGTPIANVEVTVYIANGGTYTIHETALTNAEGYAIFTLNERPIGYYVVGVDNGAVPQGYTKYQEYVSFNKYDYEEFYDCSYNFKLVRDGSANAPYVWEAGVYAPPQQAVTVNVAQGSTVYFSLYAGAEMGSEITTYYIIIYDDNAVISFYKDSNDDFEVTLDDDKIEGTLDADVGGYYVEIPVATNVLIAVSSANGEAATYLMECAVELPQ